MSVWSYLRAIGSFFRRLARRARDVEIPRTAGSLAFTTLLGVVPLFTVAFDYVARFPAFDRLLDALEVFLLRNLLPGSGAVVRKYLTEFTARTADLKGISIAIVILTALLLIAQIEQEINAIWRIRRSRSLFRRAIIYALGLTAVPVLIGGAIYSISWLIDESIAIVPFAGAAAHWLARPLALATSVVGLTAIYALVPAHPVPFRCALAGGALGGVAFESAKHGFAWYITKFPTYQLVYGALAALPLFLLWIYVSWIIVLLGAVVTATLAEPGGGNGRKRRR